VALAGVSFVPATIETAPSPYAGDSVDDVTLWFNSESPQDSRILVTLKASNLKPVKPTGVLVYDLAGEQTQFLAGGTPNNIDIRTGFDFGNGQDALIAVSNWWSNDVYFYRMDQRSLLLSRVFEPANTGLVGLRGLCMYRTESGGLFYFVLNKEGSGEKYQIRGDGSVQRVAVFEVGSNAEGCVVDDQLDRLYVAEEESAIWRFSAGNPTDKPERIARVSLFGRIQADIEGLTLYSTTTAEGRASGYLIASSQGNDHFAVFDRVSNRYITSFSIGTGELDAVSGTDGIRAISTPLGEKYPLGVFIAHDNENMDNGSAGNQNFKVVDWQDVRAQLLAEGVQLQ
jgi:3-phytase